MIFLDTTIASREDLDFVKLLNIFPRMLCDVTLLQKIMTDGIKNSDHFYRDEFDLFADVLLTESGVKSYYTYINELPQIKQN